MAKRGQFNPCQHDASLRVRQACGMTLCRGCYRESKARRRERDRLKPKPVVVEAPARFDVCNRCGLRVPGARAMAQHKSQHDGAVSSYQPLWGSSLAMF